MIRHTWRSASPTNRRDGNLFRMKSHI